MDSLLKKGLLYIEIADGKKEIHISQFAEGGDFKVSLPESVLYERPREVYTVKFFEGLKHNF